MKKKRKTPNVVDELMRLLSVALDEDLPIEDTPKVKDIDYLHREDRILSLAREKQKRKPVLSNGCFLEAVLKKLAKSKSVLSESRAYVAAMKTAKLFVDEIANKALEGDEEALNKLSELINISFRKEDILIDEDSLVFKTPTKVMTLYRESILDSGLSHQYSPRFFVGKTLKKFNYTIYSTGGKNSPYYRYIGTDKLARLALFKAITDVIAEDRVKAAWLNGFLAESIRRLSRNTDKRKAGQYSLAEKFISNFEWDVTDLFGRYEYIDCDFMGNALVYLASEYKLENEYKAFYEHASHTAKAYQTKKNIPESVLKKMESSEFNNYFGYVEFDELVELKNADEVYNDFVAINDRFFGGYKSPDVSLRFRLLGRHKALGLYYPTINCMCVDVRSPSSFIHEYFHMYDSEHGDLSAQIEFAGLRETYGRLLRAWYSKQDYAEKRRMSFSKYNLDYYLMPTEIFARCGEIYISRINGVVNSCCKIAESLGFAYPVNEDLDNQIKVYFDKLLSTAKVNEEEVEDVKLAAAASV